MDEKKSNPFDTIIVTTDQRHYRGDPRLYAIQCFTQQFYNRVVKYVQEYKTREYKMNNDSTFYSFISVMSAFRNKLNDPEKKPLSEFIVVVQCLRILDQKYPDQNIAVSAILRTCLDQMLVKPFHLSDPKSVAAQRNEYEQLIRYVQRIESFTTKDELDKSNVMDVVYFSVQRQNVSFFGTFDVAKRYAKRRSEAAEPNMSYIYVYQNYDNLSMINVSDKGSVQWLLKAGPMNAKEPFSEEILRFYNDGNAYRDSFVVNWVMNETSLENARQQLKKDIDQYIKNDPSASIVGLTTYTKRFREMYALHVYSMLDDLDDAFVFRSKYARNKFRIDLYNLVEKNLDTSYMKQLSTPAFFEDKIFTSDDMNGVHKRKFGDGIDWNDYFEYPLLSPRGVFAATFWPILYMRQLRRYSGYVEDSLILHQLIKSNFFTQYNLNGWICYDPYEIMVVDPGAHGHVQRMNPDVPLDPNDPQCQYSIK